MAAKEKWTVDSRTMNDSVWTEVIETDNLPDASRKANELQARGEEVIVRRNGRVFVELEPNWLTEQRAREELRSRRGGYSHLTPIEYASEPHKKGHHLGRCTGACRRGVVMHAHLRRDRQYASGVRR